MTSPRIVALVPMRHHSERVPGKTMRPFGDVPLYRHIVGTLLECQPIAKVVIDTDSEAVWDDVSAHFPAVRLIERPAHLREGTIPMNDVLLHDVSVIDADYYLQTHCTNPLLRPATVVRAVRALLDDRSTYDSLFSVTRLQTRLWDAEMRPVNHEPDILLRTQDLAPVYEENSCLYMFTREILEQRHNRIGARPLMFEIERGEAWDIDEELDFRVAEFLYREQTGALGATGAPR